MRTPAITSKNINGFFIHLALAVTCIIFGWPVLYMITTSIKAEGESFSNPGLIPNTVDLSKYSRVWVEANVVRYGLNSAVITIATVVLVLVLGSLAAYAFSRLRFFGRNTLMMLFLLSLMIPITAIIVPLYQINRTLGLMNSYGGVIAPYTALGLPFCVLFLRGYFDTLPREIEESARIDGASSFVIYYRILLPLTTPALATVAIFQSLSTWNEFLLALLFLTKPALRTLPLAAVMYQRLQVNTIESMFALFVIMSLPITLIYLLLQRQIMEGLTAGALKGA